MATGLCSTDSILGEECHPGYTTNNRDDTAHRYGNHTISFTDYKPYRDVLRYGRLAAYDGSGYEELMPRTRPQFTERLRAMREDK